MGTHDNSQYTLFKSFSNKGLSLQNRVVMAPMTRSRAIGNKVNSLVAEYYSQRNTAGLLITEGTAPSANGLGYPRIPGIFDATQIEAWKEVTAAAHRGGAKIFTQLMHGGRIAHTANMLQGAEIVAPSAIQAKADVWTDTLGQQVSESPREMTQADITATIAEFVSAAKNAILAGFDGIELHGANGYLIEQFINPNSNTRTDSYGGSPENRGRFLVETAKAVGDAIGFDKVGVRISPYNIYNDMDAYIDTPETYRHIVRGLEDLGIVYLHVIDRAALETKEGQDLMAEIRQTFTNTLILNGGYDAHRAEKAITGGQGDLVSFGAAYVSNPDLVEVMKTGQEWAQPDPSTFFSADEKGFTDYPARTAVPI
ncbi:MAG: alkene reductase [Chitinophagaceae bacterium]|nr:MAG: alkene reductase [Chitinophagaceae bacterium]